MRASQVNIFNMFLKDLQLANMGTGRSVCGIVLEFNLTVMQCAIYTWCLGRRNKVRYMASNRWMRLTASVAKQVMSLLTCVDDYRGKNVCRCCKFVRGNVWGID